MHRPALMGMIKSNQNTLIQKCMSAAIDDLPRADSQLAPDEAFPKSSLDALSQLRGVGIATASLILSIITGRDEPDHQVPFYSDDLYLWLCLEEYPESTDSSLKTEDGTEKGVKDKKDTSKFKKPNGELNVKYNAKEYRELWDASWKLRRRLNQAVKDENGKKSSNSRPISQNDIEKVAYVLRNISVSGFYVDEVHRDDLAVQDTTDAQPSSTNQADEEVKGNRPVKKRKLQEKVGEKRVLRRSKR